MGTIFTYFWGGLFDKDQEVDGSLTDRMGGDRWGQKIKGKGKREKEQGHGAKCMMERG